MGNELINFFVGVQLVDVRESSLLQKEDRSSYLLFPVLVDAARRPQCKKSTHRQTKFFSRANSSFQSLA